jgi:hypothetical protein
VDEFVTRFGRWMLNFPDLLHLLTHTTMLLERFGPFLLFIPFLTTPVRLLLITVFVLFHLGLGLSLELGNFPLCCALAWLALLPGAFWDWLAARAVVRRAVAWLQRMGQVLFARFQRPARGQAEAAAPRERALGLVAGAVVLFLIVYVFLGNMRMVYPQLYEAGMPPQQNQLSTALGLEQGWGVFAPAVAREGGWYVFEAQLRDGRKVDPFNGGAPAWEKPELVSATYRNPRWRKYLQNLYQFFLGHLHGENDPRFFPTHAATFAEYLRRTWDEGRPAEQQVETLQIYYLAQATSLEGRGPIVYNRLWPQPAHDMSPPRPARPSTPNAEIRP